MTKVCCGTPIDHELQPPHRYEAGDPILGSAAYGIGSGYHLMFDPQHSRRAIEAPEPQPTQQQEPKGKPLSHVQGGFIPRLKGI